MKLIAASITDKVDSFLHAGYISAYPRPLETEGYPLGNDGGMTDAVLVHQLDLASALALGDGASDTGGTDTALGTVAGLGSGDGNFLIGALALTGVMFLLYLIREKIKAHHWKPVGVLGAMALFVLAASQCGGAGNAPAKLPTSPPWEGVALQEYSNPGDATLAIVHGIVVPAVANVGQEVEILANVQNEVGLPTKTLTQGMAYALQTYGFDGWGRGFKFEKRVLKDADGYGFAGYIVTSSGEDGVFNNADDISVEFEQTINDNWGWSRNAYYLVKNMDEINVVFHRWNGKMFEYKNKDAAQNITGNDLFDLFKKDDFYNEESVTAYTAAYEDAAQGLDYSPVILQIFQ